LGSDSRSLTQPFYLAALCILAAFLSYAHSGIFLFDVWLNSEEYSHGLIIPFVIAYILWSDRANLFQVPWVERPWGLAVLGLSQLLHVAAILADLESVKLYSFILCIASLAYGFGGYTLLKKFSFPLLLLFFAVPLPHLLSTLTTAKMQLLSSTIGVWFIRLIGLPVLQDGNVIDMGSFKMLVEEACSGLRYMYPLISIGFIVAYFFKAPLWAKTLVVVLTVPITIFMNSLRIAITGLIIKQFGAAAAEGFLHDFEGWVVFMAAFALLLLCTWIIALLLPGRTSFKHRLAISAQEGPIFYENFTTSRKLLAAYGVVLVCSVVGANILSAKTENVIPERIPFAQFPFLVDGYALYPDSLSPEILDVLKADDYFIGDYKKANALPVNLYMVYYASQRDGSALHSPRDCLPGGGWEIQSLDVVSLEQIPGKVNRAIIQKQDNQLLVYYWIHQQGQNFANEFKARASLLVSSVQQNRTDGALIRIVVPIDPNDPDKAESSAQSFIGDMSTHLSGFLPR